MQETEQQVAELEATFDRLAAVVGVLRVAVGLRDGCDGYSERLDENEMRSAAVCVLVTVSEVALHLHDMVERQQPVPPRSEEVPEAEDRGQGAELNCAEV